MYRSVVAVGRRDGDAARLGLATLLVGVLACALLAVEARLEPEALAVGKVMRARQ